MEHGFWKESYTTEGIPRINLIDYIGYRYFTDDIFKFHSTYWTPVERGAEYSNRIVIPR
jgi:hypothetical protein